MKFGWKLDDCDLSYCKRTCVTNNSDSDFVAIDSVTVSQHAQNLEAEAATWNLARAFPTVTSPCLSGNTYCHGLI